ncbi:MAG: DUF1292 domain-containing protein [Thermoactinomyces sp.]|jgi:hypothetical protein
MNESGPREVYILRNRLRPGQMLQYQSKNGNPVLYRVLSEIEVNGEHYAILQKHDDHPDDAYLFHVNQGQIVEIDDEIEWENIAEAVDEMLYFHDFQ